MNNKELFLEEINKLERAEYCDIDGLLEFLNNSDFFEAPASTNYHGAYQGGLVQHSLNVFECLKNLNNLFQTNYSEDTLRVVALFHDISKANFYERYIMNKKEYKPDGAKHDEQGAFDWVAVPGYKVKEAKDRFLAGDHATNSYLLISQFIPLTLEETAAILNHHGGMDNNWSLKDLTSIYNRYPLATLLHLADMSATYLLERI